MNQCHHLFPIPRVGEKIRGVDSERPERDSPCRLLKPRQMGTIEYVLRGSSFLRCAGIFVLFWLLSPVKNTFSSRKLFYFIYPHLPASWANSRAVSPVSQCVSVYIDPLTHGKIIEGA
jgi:hypothetical protein